MVWYERVYRFAVWNSRAQGVVAACFSENRRQDIPVNFEVDVGDASIREVIVAVD